LFLFPQPLDETMLRCALIAAALVAPLVVAAQTARPFPADTLRGDLQVGVAPDVLLNSQPARLAPGSRILDANNFLVVPGTLVGQRVRVHYTQDRDGLLQDVWVLNNAELANRVWPVSREQAALWRFDPATQLWSKP
jgi:hypothetical protein